jgi:ubiquinone/menaquinone biosynthesis C-methylase UbiE
MSTSNVIPGKFLDPVEIINQLNVKEGDKVVDFGCGAGFFSIEMARRVGGSGMVYAIDVLPSALESVQSRAKTLGLTNITVKRANLESEKGSGMPEASFNWVVMKDVLFQNKNKGIMFVEAKKVLIPEGRTIVVEWDVKDFSIGPEKNLRIPKEMMKEIAESAGFMIEKELHAGNFHYSLLLKKA